MEMIGASQEERTETNSSTFRTTLPSSLPHPINSTTIAVQNGQHIRSGEMLYLIDTWLSAHQRQRSIKPAETAGLQSRVPPSVALEPIGGAEAFPKDSELACGVAGRVASCVLADRP